MEEEPCLVPESTMLTDIPISVVRRHRHQHKAHKHHLALKSLSGSWTVDPRLDLK